MNLRNIFLSMTNRSFNLDWIYYHSFSNVQFDKAYSSPWACNNHLHLLPWILSRIQYKTLYYLWSCNYCFIIWISACIPSHSLRHRSCLCIHSICTFDFLIISIFCNDWSCSQRIHHLSGLSQIWDNPKKELKYYKKEYCFFFYPLNLPSITERASVAMCFEGFAVV